MRESERKKKERERERVRERENHICCYILASPVQPLLLPAGDAVAQRPAASQ